MDNWLSSYLFPNSSKSLYSWYWHSNLLVFVLDINNSLSNGFFTHIFGIFDCEFDVWHDVRELIEGVNLLLLTLYFKAGASFSGNALIYFYPSSLSGSFYSYIEF